jgi:hypothetical protein
MPAKAGIHDFHNTHPGVRILATRLTKTVMAGTKKRPFQPNKVTHLRRAEKRSAFRHLGAPTNTGLYECHPSWENAHKMAEGASLFRPTQAVPAPSLREVSRECPHSSDATKQSIFAANAPASVSMHRAYKNRHGRA